MPTFETFYLPDAGEGLTEADIVTWLVAVGDAVEVNQPLLEVETDKAVMWWCRRTPSGGRRNRPPPR